MTEVNKQNYKEVFTEYYEEFSDAIFRYCYFQTSNREKALDLTQDTFIKTWEYLGTADKEDIKNIKAFLYKVARNLIIDYRRKKKSESLDNLQEKGFDLTSEESEIMIKEEQFEAKMAIESIEDLDRKYKEVIFMRFVEDMSVKEIAHILKKNENNISVMIHRGIDKLKDILENKNGK
ncbi:MAG: sigma-70 family RNA polymerase sigma factor [Candidatus Pacebacteria bacterium]|nr:sigma-70 family RNA polymerase sigma factor [Candidatus Paceibacterota bacterium]MCF7862845.1 sigma-70 family RNA polymerase sigma factor [Candidatus Paceibacterota bacterium]